MVHPSKKTTIKPPDPSVRHFFHQVESKMKINTASEFLPNTFTLQN
jgi:hypothetical protein